MDTAQDNQISKNLLEAVSHAEAAESARAWAQLLAERVAAGAQTKRFKGAQGDDIPNAAGKLGFGASSCFMHLSASK